MTFAICSISLSFDKIAPFLKAVLKTQKSPLIRNTGLRTIYYIIKLMSKGITKHLKTLIEMLQPLLFDELLINKVAATNCLQILAESTFPYGEQEYDTVVKDLWENVQSNKDKLFLASLKTLSALVPIY